MVVFMCFEWLWLLRYVVKSDSENVI